MNASLKRGRTIIAPLARRYAELVKETEVALASLSDEELRSVESTSRWYSDTNCSWDEFALAKGREAILSRGLAVERRRRSRLAS